MQTKRPSHHHRPRAAAERILVSLRRRLRRLSESKWTTLCHNAAMLKKQSSLVFHDTQGMELGDNNNVGAHNPRIFSYSELYVATNGFSEDEILGSGGFGKVYRATLPSDGTLVAVKCLVAKGGGDDQHIEKTFAAELISVANLRHRNLVRLRGWCSHSDPLLLVYDYMPNRSLDKILFSPRRKAAASGSVLTWERRKNIASGLAAALFYLQEQLETQIIHRDVKSSNVMLDASYNARLGDFGLARWLEHELEEHHQTSPFTKQKVFRLQDTSRIGGTIGYLAPEIFLGREASNAKSDVFSFGVVALEIASGRRAIDLSYPEEETVLVDWVRSLSDEGKLIQAADTRLTDGSADEIRLLIHLGLLCTLHDPRTRPNMKWILDALSGNIFGSLPELPSFKSHPLYISLSSSSSNTTSSSILRTGSTFTVGFSTGTDNAEKTMSMYVTAKEYDDDDDHKAATLRCRKNFRMFETPRKIAYKDIVSATENFSDSKRVAEIDFGTAYHGFLDNSYHVIVKRLSMTNCPVLRMRFSNEFENLARLLHRSLVQLRGWCTEQGEMLVVYDYSPGRLLSHFLFHNCHRKERRVLLWRQRYNIIKLLASAVYYLHEEWEEQVIHRNITSSAIILDPDMNPRLGSFALAEFMSRNGDGLVERNRSVRGIFGYMAPEYMESGEATTMADVYSFGVVLLEVVTGMMAVDFRWPGGLLVKRVHDFESRERPYEELADWRLDGEYDREELIRLIKLGMACTRSTPELRPNMKQIVNILEGHDKCLLMNGLKKETRQEWRRRNASSLFLVRRIQAVGIH